MKRIREGAELRHQRKAKKSNKNLVLEGTENKQINANISDSDEDDNVQFVLNDTDADGPALSEDDGCPEIH